MFSLKLEKIITKDKLYNSFLNISKGNGIDEVSYEKFKKNLNKNLEKLNTEVLNNTYTPEPLKQISINKSNSSEKRIITLASIKDKILQKTIYDNMNSYFDKSFSKNSYGYRLNKSTIDAVNKVYSYIEDKNLWVFKSDIDNFFDSINHEKLLSILVKQIEDERLINLIFLFIKMGTFIKDDFNTHERGLHQGDILSPLLSNMYLDIFDKFLEKRDISFVRYADDFVILAFTEKEIYFIKSYLENFLKSLDVLLEKKKSYIHHINDGFSFLGVSFVGKNRYIDENRFKKLIVKLNDFNNRDTSFQNYIKEINIYLHTLKNYYLKIISKNSPQYIDIKNSLIDVIANKVYENKKNKVITTKKSFKEYLSELKLDLIIQNDKEIKNIYDLIILKAYEKYLSEKTYIDSNKKINKKKIEYTKKYSNDSTLHILTPGVILGISKNKFSIKKYGKVQKSYPISKVSRIIIEGKGIGLSSNIIKRCSDNNITIDFIDRNAYSYATLITYKNTMPQNIKKQYDVLSSSLGFDIAKQFIKGKAKNQINYIKYLNKYHKTLNKNISKMTKLLKEGLSNAKTKDELMGYEGSISVIYWASLRVIIKVPFEKRITYQAKDIVNSSLNYAYAILYGKIQHYLVYAGLNLNISFLHSITDNKPTLTFDMIEEFRTFIVDRTIISMLNKEEPMFLDKDGLLTKDTRILISKNIKEKLSSYTIWKKESIKCENIISSQVYLLKSTINKEKKYKAFIGKF